MLSPNVLASLAYDTPFIIKTFGVGRSLIVAYQNFVDLIAHVKSKQTIPPAELPSISVIDKPFSKIIVECVGLLPKTT